MPRTSVSTDTPHWPSHKLRPSVHQGWPSSSSFYRRCREVLGKGWSWLTAFYYQSRPVRGQQAFWWSLVGLAFLTFALWPRKDVMQPPASSPMSQSSVELLQTSPAVASPPNEANLKEVSSLLRLAPYHSALPEEPVPRPNQGPHWDTLPFKNGISLLQALKNLPYFSEKDRKLLSEAHPHLKKNPILKRDWHEIRYQLYENQIKELIIDSQPGLQLIVKRQPKRFIVQEKRYPLEKKVQLRTARIQSSLSSAAKQAGLDQRTIQQINEVFGQGSDFSKRIRKNDVLKILWEDQYHKGRKVEGRSKVLAFEVHQKDKKLQAIHFTDKKGQSSFFSPDGKSLASSFLRTPVQFSRVSCHFGSRKHPIFHVHHHHSGVDLAAPIGTPIKAASDAVVTFVGQKKGYGRVVELKHGPQYATLYGHLSSFAKSIRPGSRVKQGDIIGYVGRSGLATGPHLHYEVKINGVHKNPLTVALPKARPLDGSSKHEFTGYSKRILSLLDQSPAQRLEPEPRLASKPKTAGR